MDRIPCNENASKNSVKLLGYLCDVAGKGIITGQHTQTVPMEELVYIAEKTGRSPKLIGFELLSYSPNVNYKDAGEACITEVLENRKTLPVALEMGKGVSDWSRPEKILTFSFHWFSPMGGRDKSFYSENTDFDPRKVLVEDTDERKAFYSDMDVIAAHLKAFAEADIPVLWRPFHESYGEWFWWGRYGAKVARDLYVLMYKYFVFEKHLNNLLWVWNCDIKEAYPGDEFVDVNSIDVYLEEYAATDYREQYEKLIKNTSDSKVCALAEVGYIPDVDMLADTNVPWAYYMCWSKEFCMGEQYNSVDQLKKMYTSDYSI